MLIERVEKVYGSELDDQICLFHSESARYYILNSTGSMIWDLLSSPKTEEEIISSCQKEFKVDELNFRNEINEFINDGIKKGILNIIDS